MKPNDVSQEAWDAADKALVGWTGTSVHVVCARLIMAAKAEERKQILSSLRKLYQACAGEHEAQMAIGDAIDIVTERT